MATPDVRVRLSAEGVSEVVTALRRVQAEAAQAATKGKSTFGGFNSVLATTKGLLASITAIIGVGAVLNLAKQGAAAADEMGKLAQKTGTTVRNISALAFAAKTADVETAQLQQSLGLLTKQLVELEKGTPATVSAFRALGLSSKDFAGKDTAEAFGLIAERMGRLKDSSAKTAVALQIFGRSGAQLIPLLNDLSENGLQGAIDKGTQLGVVFDDVIAAKTQQLNDDLETLKQQTIAAAAQFIGGFAPDVSRALQGFSEDLGDNSRVVEEWGRRFGFVVTQIGSGLVAAAALVDAISKSALLILRLGRGGPKNLSELKAELAAIKKQFDDTILSLDNAVNHPRLGPSRGPRGAGSATITNTDIVGGNVKEETRQANEEVEKTVRTLREARDTTSEIVVETNEWADAARGVVTSGLADFFIRGTSAAETFLASLRRLTAEMLAQKLVAGVPGWFSGIGGGGGGGGTIAPDFGSAASGGLIVGGGTGTSDSIHGRLSANEYVVRAAAVRQPGVLSMLHGLNYGKRGYADGGLVEGSGGATSLSSSLTIGLDTGLVLRAMESAEGQRVIIKTLGAHRRAVRSIGR